MKLYSVADGPPSLAVQMALKYLNIPYELIDINYIEGEHMTDKYAEMNPQKEIPVLEDDGLYLSESVAILQYLCDKYAPDNAVYPKDPRKRAIVNQRLCFNLGYYYNHIFPYAIAPLFFDYPKDERAQRKVEMGLSAFEAYLKRTNTKYVASENLTIADFPLVTATMCLEAIDYNMDKYALVKKWYETFKKEYPDLWKITDSGLKITIDLVNNNPDMSHMDHPIHPKKK